MAKYSWLVIGSGIFGATFSREMTDAGRRVLVVEKRAHIGGNCYTEEVEGIHIHRMGGHLWHSNDRRLWDYVNRFAEFRQYEHGIKVNYKDRYYSFPINLDTLMQVYKLRSPQDALGALERDRAAWAGEDLTTLQGWALSQVGYKLYTYFIKGYTEKQWQKNPAHLPASIIKRIPIRRSFDDRYFSDKYQGVPVNGYTAMFERMLDGIDLELNTDYIQEREELDKLADRVLYTGEIDRFYDYIYGRLEYRSLRHDTQRVEGDALGIATINYTDRKIPYTRILEHKHYGWLASDLPHSYITYEYPAEYMPGLNLPYYPLSTVESRATYLKYKALGDKEERTIFGGRLATYSYIDMGPCIAQAMVMARQELTR